MRSIIAPLNGVRGFAVLLVVLSHASYHEHHLIEGLNFNGLGKSGVFIFFVLSAFLLTHGLLVKSRSVADLVAAMPLYLTRRVLRIYPLYLLALTASLAVSLIYAPFYVDSLGSLIGHLLLLEGRGIFWTIPVEFGYYLILPIVVAGLLVARKRPGLVFTLLILFVTLWQGLFPPEFLPYTPYYLSLFLMGSVAAYAFYYTERHYPDMAASRLFRGLATTACALSLAAIALTAPAFWGYLTGREIPQNHFHYNFIMFGVISTALILGAAWSAPVLRRFFSSRVMVYLGEISFSIYIWHIFIANGLGLFPEIPGPLRFALYGVLVIALAHVSHALVEKPFLKMKSFREIWYWHHRPKRQRAPA